MNDARTRLLIPALAPLYDALSPLMLPMVRVAAGLILMPHGAQKLFGWFGGGGLEGTAGFFASAGLEPALFLALLVGITEFFGGLLLALGLLTRPVAAAITVMLAVIVFDIHWASGFFAGNGGVEYPLLWGTVTLAFAVRGGGAYSLDRRIGREF
jgi:putative oxidoreductase